MKICTLGASVFATNTYLVIDEDTNKAVLIDPDGNGKQYAAFLDQEGVSLEAILLTHGHFDHIGAVDELVEIKKVPVYIHAKDEELLHDGAKNASSVFFGGKGIVCNTKPRIIKDTDTLFKKLNHIFKAERQIFIVPHQRCIVAEWTGKIAPGIEYRTRCFARKIQQRELTQSETH